MDFDPSDSSGTDDDLPPTHHDRGIRGGHPTGNGRTAAISDLPYNRPNDDMEIHIHRLEQEAYASILRAFKAQSDAITWEKESLMTGIRKELRVTDDEHRTLLGRVNADDLIHRIREWRQSVSGPTGFLSNAPHVYDSAPSLVSARKKPKTSRSIPSMPMGGPPSSVHSQMVTASLPTSSAGKRGPPSGARGKKSKSVWSDVAYCYVDANCTRLNFSSSGPVLGVDPAELIGRKVRTKWPYDKNFYLAVITDYDPIKGLHSLVYDMHTTEETWEFVNLKEIPPDEISWDVDDLDLGFSGRAGRGGPPRGPKKPMRRGGGVQGTGRGRGSLKNFSHKNYPQSQNGIGKKGPDDIEILHTDSLIKEVERVFSSSNPDVSEVDKVKKALKEHEQSLIDAIARLTDASDGESAEDGNHQFSQGQKVWRNRQQHLEAIDVDGGRMVGVGAATSDYNRQEGINVDGDEDV